jgi:hypothetical protein
MFQKSWFSATALAFFGLSCTHFRSPDYFPLTPHSNWTYKVTSHSQGLQFHIIDKVVGVEYVPVLKRTGIVVNERYDIERGGTRPLLYYSRRGYLTQLFGFDYYHRTIRLAPWGISEEPRYLPSRLAPNISWHSIGAPYGSLPGSFHLRESHHTFAQPGEVIVVAGHFKGCIRVDTRAVFEGGPYARFKDGVRLYYSDWYAPDVGLVRSIARGDTVNSAELERVELVDFKVVPQPLTMRFPKVGLIAMH